MVKKYAVYVLVVALLLVSVMLPIGGRIVSAQTTSTSTSQNPLMELTVDVLGNAMLQGTVQSVGTNTMTVSSWGGTWTINTTSSTQMTPVGTNSNLSTMRVGDLVNVLGTVPLNQNLMINATVVSDLTMSGTVPVMTQILLMGPVTAINGNTLTVTGPNNISYTVNVGSGTVLWNTARNTIGLNTIQTNDIVRVQGTLNNFYTVTPSIIRDVSR